MNLFNKHRALGMSSVQGPQHLKEGPLVGWLNVVTCLPGMLSELSLVPGTSVRVEGES